VKAPAHQVRSVVLTSRQINVVITELKESVEVWSQFLARHPRAEATVVRRVTILKEAIEALKAGAPHDLTRG
jgi:hypothetical protein